jgi:hypothetical protein
MLAQLSKTINYSLLSLLHPGARDFLDMGFGIEARHRRCHSYWAKHIANSLAFQESALREIVNGENVAVLGAGRLLDINLPELRRSHRHVELIDADPSALSTWRKKAPERDGFSHHISEVTGTLSSWTKQLERAIEKRGPAAGEALRALNTLPSPLAGRKFDTVLSVNLLSQIPVYWNDRASALLRKHRGLETDSTGNFPPAVQSALESSLTKLQSQHLELLGSLGAREVILIFDRAFLYYRTDHAHWQEERSIYIENPVLLNGYEVTAQDSWLWHIAPQSIEEKDYGLYCEVQAMRFSQSVGFGGPNS